MKNIIQIIVLIILFTSCSASREKDFISADPLGGEPPPETIMSENIDDSIYEVQFINENLGFAGAKQNVLKTIDGGESWSEWDPQKARGQGWNLTPSITEILFISESVGFINRGYGKLFKTSDGGISYEQIYELESGVIMDIYYENGTLFLSGSNIKKSSLYDDDDGENNPTSFRKNTMILTSENDGESFKIFDFEDSNDANNEIYDTHGHFSLIVKNNILFFDIGYSNAGYQRTEKNWVVRFDLNTNDLEDFVYNDDRQSFLDSGMIIETPPIRIKSYSKVDNYIYAFGHYFRPSSDSKEDNGFIYSTNNGESWTYKSFGKYEEITFFSSYFSSTNVGYIVGELGHFLKTTDGGNTWTKIDLGTYRNIFDIEKVNENTLILVGEDGFIYKYTM